MTKTILEFISIFQSPSNNVLFTEVACYWFATILHQRFPASSIVYNPDKIHFATRIRDKVYDISGIIVDGEDYIDWDIYAEEATDVEFIIECCMKLKGGE